MKEDSSLATGQSETADIVRREALLVEPPGDARLGLLGGTDGNDCLGPWQTVRIVPTGFDGRTGTPSELLTFSR